MDTGSQDAKRSRKATLILGPGGVSEVNEWVRIMEHALREGNLRLMNGIGLGDMHYGRGYLRLLNGIGLENMH